MIFPSGGHDMDWNVCRCRRCGMTGEELVETQKSCDEIINAPNRDAVQEPKRK